jgi:hypothetical protein
MFTSSPFPEREELEGLAVNIDDKDVVFRYYPGTFHKIISALQ